MWTANLPEQINVTLKKLRDQILKEIRIGVDINSAVKDLKRIINHNFGLLIEYMYIFKGGRLLENDTRLKDLLEHLNENNDLCLVLDYRYDDEEEFFKKVNENKTKINNENLKIKNIENISQSDNYQNINENSNQNFNNNNTFINNKRIRQNDEFHFNNNINPNIYGKRKKLNNNFIPNNNNYYKQKEEDIKFDYTPNERIFDFENHKFKMPNITITEVSKHNRRIQPKIEINEDIITGDLTRDFLSLFKRFRDGKLATESYWIFGKDRDYKIEDLDNINMNLENDSENLLENCTPEDIVNRILNLKVEDVKSDNENNHMDEYDEINVNIAEDEEIEDYIIKTEPLEEIEEEIIPVFNNKNDNEKVIENQKQISSNFVIPEINNDRIINPSDQIITYNNINLPMIIPKLNYKEILIKDFAKLLTQINYKSINYENLLDQKFYFEEEFSKIHIDQNFLNFNKKMNVILDIDSSILFCNNENRELSAFEEMDDDIKCFKMEWEGKHVTMKLRLRRGLKEFLERLNRFSVIYINTHGVINYGLHVAKIIKSKFGIDIPKDRIIGRIDKVLPKMISQFPNIDSAKTIILDDSPNVWETDYTNVISSMKYLSFFDKKINIDSHLVKKGLNFPIRMNFCNTDKFPFLIIEDKYKLYDFNAHLAMEYEYSTKSQLEYLTETFEKIYKIVSITNCDVRDVINYLRSTILCGIKINIDYQFAFNDKERTNLISVLIKQMGGKISDRQSATHFIVERSKLFQLKKDRKEKNWNCKFILNLKFLFHSYYFMKKVDENDLEYTDLFENYN